jgi:hypothetical protein
VASLQLERFVFDTRFAEAFDAAGEIERHGVVLAPITGDLMEFWYDELDLLWKERPMTLAGVATEDALFVLETFAQDRGMRVAYRGRHDVAKDGTMQHALSGPVAWLDALQSDMHSRAWTTALAEALVAYPSEGHEMASAEVSTPMAGISLRDVALFSWLIAPRAIVATTAP